MLVDADVRCIVRHFKALQSLVSTDRLSFHTTAEQDNVVRQDIASPRRFHRQL